MSQPPRNAIPDRTAYLLNAYRDGELSGFARWRFERELRRSPELQRELAALSRIGDWVRESHAEPAGADLWDRIALRLPALDARRAEAGEAARPGLGWLAWPGAFASVAVAAVVAFQWLAAPTPNRIGVVRWIDSGPRDVMVLEAAPDTTIVWVIGAPGKRPGSA
jgi:anti-sigma factor RsiW